MNRALLLVARAVVIVVAPVGFCSCQSLQRSAVSKSESPRLSNPQTGEVVPTNTAATPPRPTAGQAILTPGYYPPPGPHTMSVAPAAPRHAPVCACCAPKQGFAFSDQANTCGPGGCGPGGCGPGGCGPGGCGPNGCGPGGAMGNVACAYQPYDEYICDGGDNELAVDVRHDLSIRGLDQEDTIVHFDTMRGNTEWTASNKVCLYAPRFAAVRQVTGMELSEQADRLAGANKALPPILDRDLKIVSDLNQPQRPIGRLGIKQSQSVLERQMGLTAETTRHLSQIHLDLLPYENLDLIRRGVVTNSDKPRLAQVAANAVVWTDTKAVQVVLDKKLPLEAVRETTLGETVMYDLAGKARMRICKIADKSEAQPGDIVSFTLRFDNVGDQKVSNVTIVDNLTTRLEYVEGSQECSHEATFEVTPNDGETLVLRWEIEDPLRVGEGGIIRFQCRVR